MSTFKLLLFFFLQSVECISRLKNGQVCKCEMVLLILKDFSEKVQVVCNDHLSHDPILFVLYHQTFAQNRNCSKGKFHFTLWVWFSMR